MRWSKEHVRAYRDRDWSAFERAPVKLDATRHEALAASLYEQVRAAVPGWPTREQRDEDLAAHLMLVTVFDRIRDAQRSSDDPR